MTHAEMAHHFPSSLCARCKFLFLFNPNSVWHITQVDFHHHYTVYQTGQKSSQGEFTGIHYSHYKCFADGRLLLSQIFEQACVDGVAPSCLFPELKVCSGQIKSIQARRERLCQVTFTSASFPRKASHQSNQNNSTLPRLESSLLTTEPCTSGTPSLTALQFRLFGLLSFVYVMSCFAKRDDGVNLLPPLKLLN